ncbi:MAG TPA: outer membrane beta-barrel protein [Gemmatimonadaceae bacterium]|nr:outer membrane beta-barrel protein [Gemmatimonadaceae bacterium]
MSKRLLSTLAGATLAVAAVAPVAVAQDAAMTRAVRFGIEGGLSMPMGDFGDAANMGFLIGGVMDIMPANWPVAIRTNLSYQRWGIDEDLADGESFNAISVTGDAMFAIPTTGGIRPYILGGLGFYRSDCSADCEGSNDLGFNFGGGLNFNLGTLDTHVEARYHSVDDDSFVPIVFGIRF